MNAEAAALSMRLTTRVARAYVGNNPVSPDALPALLGSIRGAFDSLFEPPVAVDEPPKLVPAVAIKASVTQDFIVCLEDGRKLKSLKRHLMSSYGLTPAAYRAKWGLSADYPMVAPAYALRRSELAKASGLGVRGQKPGAPEAKPRKRPPA